MLKQLLLVFITLFLASISYAQNASTWDKEQKNLVYSECDKELKSSGISSKDREEFCYCFLQKLTNEFTPTDLSNLIAPEQRKVSERYYTSCYEETGVRYNYTNNNASTYGTKTWNREQRNYHYKKCQTDLFEKNYKVTNEEQEEFCLCYLDKLTSNYSPGDINNMITPELKKAQNKLFNTCSGETGISLSTNNIGNTVVQVFTGDWDKEKKNGHYKTCENDLRNNGNNYTEDQIEEFCLCYIDRLSSNYSAKELDDMISPELKRVKERVYSKCTSKTDVGTMNIEGNMLGRWESNTGEVLIFKADGGLRYIYDENDMDEAWRWKYKSGNILSFISDGVEIEYKVLEINSTYIKYTPKRFSKQIYEYYKK